MAHHPRSPRRGISLLEVLISMFILLFGLLGVASMFPVGQLYVSQSAVYDRASAVGQAAFHDIQTRGLLNPEAGVWLPNGDGAVTLPLQFDPIEGGAVATIPGFKRVTVNGLTTNDSIGYVFGSRDDLVVEFPVDDDSPALQPASAMTREHNGHFSWMFTVTNPGGNADGPFSVSVAVFDRRVRDSEANFTGATLTGGLGGGQIVINVNDPKLEVLKTGDWVHLSTDLGLHRWYRIVNITPWDPAGTGRTLTVAGADWGNAATGTVTIFDRVVAVYEKVMPRAD